MINDGGDRVGEKASCGETIETKYPLFKMVGSKMCDSVKNSAVSIKKNQGRGDRMGNGPKYFMVVGNLGKMSTPALKNMSVSLDNVNACKDALQGLSTIKKPIHSYPFLNYSTDSKNMISSSDSKKAITKDHKYPVEAKP